MSDKKVICVLDRCNKTVSGWRIKRKHPTCSSACTQVKEANRQTIKRAKAQHRAIVLCANADGNCSRLVVRKKDHNGLCEACARLTGNLKSDKVSGVGKSYCDTRHKICNNNGAGPLCDNYNKCMTFKDVGKGKLGPIELEYDTNGGINCHRSTKQVERVNYGTSGAICSENY